MKSVLTKTQQELADASARSFRLISALGLATAATLLALLGMMSRYAQGEDAPLPGMDELAGQVGWSVGGSVGAGSPRSTLFLETNIFKMWGECQVRA